MTQHAIFQSLIDIDGDTARGETYFLAHHRPGNEAPDEELVLGGRYVDRFERRASVWKIAHRVVVYDWSRVTTVNDVWDAAPTFERGRPSRADISYRGPGPIAARHH
jgi:hypothetical protein